MKYALINKDTDKIENIIIWDGISSIDLANNILIEELTYELQEKWTQQNIIIEQLKEPIELNEEQKLLKILLEKYGIV